MDLELYQNLQIRYRNSVKRIDDNGLKGIILFNETPQQMREMWIKYKYSKFGYKETVEFELIKSNGERIPQKKNIYEIDIIEFVKFGLKRGYDWKLFGQPEWEELQPKKKKKFMKPRKR